MNPQSRPLRTRTFGKDILQLRTGFNIPQGVTRSVSLQKLTKRLLLEESKQTGVAAGSGLITSSVPHGEKITRNKEGGENYSRMSFKSFHDRWRELWPIKAAIQLRKTTAGERASLSVWKVTGVPEPDSGKGFYSWLSSLRTMGCLKRSVEEASNEQ